MTVALPSLSVTTRGVPVGRLDEPLAGFDRRRPCALPNRPQTFRRRTSSRLADAYPGLRRPSSASSSRSSSSWRSCRARALWPLAAAVLGHEPSRPSARRPIPPPPSPPGMPPARAAGGAAAAGAWTPSASPSCTCPFADCSTRARSARVGRDRRGALGLLDDRLGHGDRRRCVAERVGRLGRERPGAGLVVEERADRRQPVGEEPQQRLVDQGERELGGDRPAELVDRRHLELDRLARARPAAWPGRPSPAGRARPGRRACAWSNWFSHIRAAVSVKFGNCGPSIGPGDRRCRPRASVTIW